LNRIERAVISVSDKAGVVDLAKGLRHLGVEIVSTGGTAALLRKEGLDTIGVSELTGFPEMLDGRVKTLHPALFAGILARRDKSDHMAQLDHMHLKRVDLVVVNLYPFKETVVKDPADLEDIIENIDIGGPSLIRAAAKNYEGVAVVTDPRSYPR
jgi:phosphoribosylaminoimidazolecarboxamide formyltransferase/IMP cyclohydrolase